MGVYTCAKYFYIHTNYKSGLKCIFNTGPHACTAYSDQLLNPNTMGTGMKLEKRRSKSKSSSPKKAPRKAAVPSDRKQGRAADQLGLLIDRKVSHQTIISKTYRQTDKVVYRNNWLFKIAIVIFDFFYFPNCCLLCYLSFDTYGRTDKMAYINFCTVKNIILIFDSFHFPNCWLMCYLSFNTYGRTDKMAHKNFCTVK